MPRASFLMPAYNAADTLPRALASMQSQTMEDLEIVVVDDGSEDDTWGLLQDAARADPRIRPLRTAHLGIVKALNHGLAHCVAEYVARLDADDVAFDDRLADQIALLEARPNAAAVACHVELLHPDAISGEGMRAYLGWINGLDDGAQIAAARFIWSPVVHSTVTMRTAVVRALGGYRDAPSPEDYDLWLRLIGAGYVLDTIPRCLVAVTDSPRRVTRTDPRCSRQAFDACRVHHLACDVLRGQTQALVWGAGTTGKRLVRALTAAGRPPRLIADGNPRRHGARIENAEVVGPAVLVEARAAMHDPPPVLVAVAARDARSDLREFAAAQGWVEGVDFYFTAGMG